MTKKILLMITAACAALALTLTAAPVTVTADATYYTKFLDRGVVAYNDVAVVGVNVEVAGFVLGASTFNTIQANAVGKNIVSSGLLKRIDTTVGYKFTAPLANLTLGSVYSSYSKSISNIASTNEPFVKLDTVVTVVSAVTRSRVPAFVVPAVILILPLVRFDNTPIPGNVPTPDTVPAPAVLIRGE
jgi:hypothetical protein